MELLREYRRKKCCQGLRALDSTISSNTIQAIYQKNMKERVLRKTAAKGSWDKNVEIKIKTNLVWSERKMLEMISKRTSLKKAEKETMEAVSRKGIRRNWIAAGIRWLEGMEEVVENCWSPVSTKCQEMKFLASEQPCGIYSCRWRGPPLICAPLGLRHQAEIHG